MKKAFDIIVDVGAASGEFTKHVLRLNQNNFVYAINLILMRMKFI